MAQFNVDYFNTIDTEQKAYILGFLQADGSFSCKGRIKGYYRYKLSIQELDEHILLAMQSELNHSGKLTIQKRKESHHQNLLELSLNGIEFTESIKELFGGYLKDDRVNFPILPQTLLRHYIRGVVDADGSFGDYQGVMIRIEGKETFLMNIRDITGFKFSLSKGNGRTTYTLKASGEEALNVVEWLYSGLDAESLFLNRKYSRAKSILNTRGIKFQEAI